MSFKSQYGLNQARVDKGVPFTVVTYSDGSEGVFNLSFSNPNSTEWKTAFDAKTRPYQQQLQRKRNSDLATKLYLETVCEVCIKSWSNIRDDNGMVLPFSSEAALKLLTEYPMLADDVTAFCADRSNFVGTFDEEEATKN